MEALIIALTVQLAVLRAERQAWTEVFGETARGDRRYVLDKQIPILEAKLREYTKASETKPWRLHR